MLFPTPTPTLQMGLLSELCPLHESGGGMSFLCLKPKAKADPGMSWQAGPFHTTSFSPQAFANMAQPDGFYCQLLKGVLWWHAWWHPLISGAVIRTQNAAYWCLAISWVSESPDCLHTFCVDEGGSY